MADQSTQTRAHPVAPSGDSSGDSAASGNAPGDKPRSPPHRSLFALRREIPRWQALLFGLACVVACGGGWWFVTRENPAGDRILSPLVLPSPSETFAEFPSLWFDQALTRNLLASLQRVALGFLLASIVGVPVGILCGCFPWFNSFLAPVTIFGRNVPLVALIPLSLFLFGTGEEQKIMFIFLTSVAFIMIDTATAVINVSDRYIDTAYTLGAGRWQIIRKVIFPLALPSIFDSLRLLFGLAFGYIMLAEIIRSGDSPLGIGGIISVSQRLGHREDITLILIIIPIVALTIDRALFWIQRQLFPYHYGGRGWLHQGVRASLHTWEDFGSFFRRAAPAAARIPSQVSKRRSKSAGDQPMTTNASRTSGVDESELPSRLLLEAGAPHSDSEAARVPLAASVGVGQVLQQVQKQSKADAPHVVEFRHVTKTYNENTPQAFTAIKDVSFVVAHVPDKAEFVCILGSSGCGKSTILRLIAGLQPQHPPTSGQVLVLDRPVSGPGADRGMVFQDYTSFDHRSVLDNITFGLECQGVARRERDELGREWIERVGLDVAVDAEKYPHELSGGMRQRVAIARTLILRPRIILMDEPFGALDPQTRTAMQDLLVKLGREVEATVFFVTHSIEEAVFLGDRIYVMGHGPGRILQELEVEPADRSAKLMLRDPRFQETVYYIRDMIDRLEQLGKDVPNSQSAAPSSGGTH